MSFYGMQEMNVIHTIDIDKISSLKITLKIIEWIKEIITNKIAQLNAMNAFDAVLEIIFLILICMVAFFVIFQCFEFLLQSTIDIFKIVADFLIVALKWGGLFFGIVLFLWFFLNPDRQCLFKFENAITRCVYIEKSKQKTPAPSPKKESKNKTQK